MQTHIHFRIRHNLGLIQSLWGFYDIRVYLKTGDVTGSEEFLR